MAPIWGILENKILWAAFAAWIFAQLIKGFFDYLKGQKFTIPSLIASGGMPSSHTAFTTGLAVSIGLRNGFSTSEFALALGLAFIVMYDAAGVRHEAGKQAQQLNHITQVLRGESLKFNDMFLKERLGHTWVQVFWGTVLGIVVAVLFPYIFG